MITPAQVKSRSETLYQRYVKRWLLGDAEQFPLRVSGAIRLSPTDFAGNQRGIELLRARSKERIGWGYRLEEKHVASSIMGHGMRPIAVWIDTLDDLLRLAGKRKHFKRVAECVERLRTEFPSLEGWCKHHWRKLPNLHEDLDAMILVVRYFLEHPRPECFPQQLPIAVGTKFIKGHERILTEWLDIILPSAWVVAHEKSFARRFGLRESQVHRRALLHDPELLEELGLPYNDFSAPVSSLANLSVKDATVVIVENPKSLESVPPLPRGLVFCGEGMSVCEVKGIPWLYSNRVLYWGDIDPAGYQILAALRASIPHVESVLMDRATYDSHAKFSQPVRQRAGELVHLTVGERTMYQFCLDNKLQLEQEKLSQKWVCEAFAVMLSGPEIGLANSFL